MEITLKDAKSYLNNKFHVRDLEVSDLKHLGYKFNTIKPDIFFEMFMETVNNSSKYFGPVGKPKIEGSHIQIYTEDERGQGQDVIQFAKKVGIKEEEKLDVIFSYDRIQMILSIGQKFSINKDYNYKHEVGYIYSCDSGNPELKIAAGNRLVICNNLSIISADHIFGGKRGVIEDQMTGLEKYLKELDENTRKFIKAMEQMRNTFITYKDLHKMFYYHLRASAEVKNSSKKANRIYTQYFDDNVIKDTLFCLYNTNKGYNLTDEMITNDKIPVFNIYNSHTEAQGHNIRDLSTSNEKYVKIFDYYNKLPELILN